MTEQRLTQYPAPQAISRPAAARSKGSSTRCAYSGRQREIALVCHGPLSDSELALIDGTIDMHA